MSGKTFYYLFKQWCFSQIGTQCKFCDSSKNLQIDHVNPQDKCFSICKNWDIRTPEEVIEELRKCQPLCQPCHGKKSGQESSKRLSKDREQCHGTYSQYNNFSCRCEPCKQAYQKYRITRKLKQGGYVRGPYQKAVCGTYSKYIAGCRCAPCGVAHTERQREMRKKKKYARVAEVAYAHV